MSSIEDILQVTCNTQDTRGYSLVQTEDINGDGHGSLRTEDVDAVLLYQLIENESLMEPFAYLNSCFQRCQQQKRLNKNGSPSLGTVFQEIDRLVVGYGLVMLQVEGFSPNGDFMSHIKQIINDMDRYMDFLSQLIQRSIVEGTVMELLEGFFPTLLKYVSQELQYFDLNDSSIYNAVLTVFEMFVTFKPISAVFTQVTGFFGDYDCKPNEFEKTTILGPILTLSPLNPNVALKNYGENLERTQQQKNIIHESLQTEHKVVVERLFFILDKIVRGSSTSREDVMGYFSRIVNKNHLRRGEHANQNKLASNAFMTNISLILIKFSEPFLDISFKRIDKIDVNYFNNLNLFIDLSSETRVNSDFKEADEFYDKNKKDEDCKPNFISDCFFLTMTYLHYGIGGTLLYDEKITPQIKRLRQEIDRIKSISQSQDMFATFASVHLKQMEKSLKVTQSIKDSLQGFFSHRYLQLEIFDFICGASVFLMRAIDPEHLFPTRYFKLPLIPDQVGVENVDNADYLRANAPIPFKYYPEFVIEGPINYSLYISQYNTSPIFMNPRLSSFVELATTILRCPELVSNPHLKGKLVQLLSVGAMPLTDDSPGFMMDVFETDTFVSDYLLYAFLDFYVIVEKTGSSSQFYDKFNSRYSISIILEQLYYRVPKYKAQLIWQANNNADFFVRFVARMLNDLTFLLDEGLGNLAEVHNISIELENRAKGLPPTREEDERELRSKYASAERQAKSSCGLADKSITLFEIYTKDIPNAFVTPEIVDRLASMLDHNLGSLVGPKCGKLKVKDPQKFSFDPKRLLKSLTTVYIHLADQHSFVSAVAKDGRSFSKELFERAVHILAMKIGLVSDDFCHKLLEFAQRAEEQKATEEAEDIGFDEVPDDFLDPLMFTLMNDPVILPASRVSIDRSTIKAHLLSDSTDPFNRMPLKLEQVTPNHELKKQIEEFKRQRKGNNV